MAIKGDASNAAGASVEQVENVIVQSTVQEVVENGDPAAPAEAKEEEKVEMESVIPEVPAS